VIGAALECSDDAVTTECGLAFGAAALSVATYGAGRLIESSPRWLKATADMKQLFDDGRFQWV
jgi:hypothetical protein